jgi:predicted GNAT family N-acyltransferase
VEKVLPIIIAPMHQNDINNVALLHTQEIMIFVARNKKDQIIGYIQWIQKRGFHKESVIELEQIAVLQNQQGKGIRIQLIKESLSDIKNYLSDSSSKLKAIIVSTRTDNAA